LARQLPFIATSKINPHQMFITEAKRPTRRIGYSLLFTIFMLCGISLPAQPIAISDEFALTGASIYPAPGEAMIPDGVVLVSHGKIMAVGKKGEISVPAGMQTIDCTGQTLLAGFWNTHVHFMEPKWNGAARLPATQLTAQMQDMLTRYGFTSVVDIGSELQNTLALRSRVTTGEVKGPRILTAGMIIFPKDGIPYYISENVPPEVLAVVEKSEAATPADAVRIVDEQLGQGADVVKLMAVSIMRPNGQIAFKPMSLSVVRAATAEAHRKGKLVFAHPTNMEGIELVLAGHVDVLAHTTEEPSKWDSTVSRRLKAANVTLIPTLTLFDRDQDFDDILKEVKGYADIGGQIMFGTDIGYLQDYPSLTKEFGYLARAGLTFPQILATLTTVPAARLGFAGSTGTIRQGMDADLVVLDGDPARDQSAFYHVALTLRQGRVIYQKSH
jgi:imidazolonepropionase-like amidohydrolase